MKKSEGIYRLEVSTNESDYADWNNRISKLSQVHYEQSSLWGKYRALYGWKHQLVKIFKDDEYVAGFLLQYSSKLMLWKIGYLSQGPLFFNDSEELSIDDIANPLVTFFKKEGYSYVLVDWHYLQKINLDLLGNVGFRRNKFNLPPTIIVKATSIIDLSIGETALLKSFSRNITRNFKKAENAGFIFRIGTRDDIPIFFDLMKDICARRKEVPHPATIDHFYRIWDLFSAKNQVILILLEYEGRPICAGFSFVMGDTFRFWKIGWNGQFSDVGVTKYFYWLNMRFAMSKECMFFDLVQVDPTMANAYLRGVPIDKSFKEIKIYGPTNLKLMFKGELFIYPENCVFINGLWGHFFVTIYRIYRTVVSFISKVRLVKNKLKYE